jgi:hypothetical protein
LTEVKAGPLQNERIAPLFQATGTWGGREKASGGGTVDATIGHNRQGLSVDIEVRFFNSILPYANGRGIRQMLSVEPGTTIGDLAARLEIPLEKLFLVLVNGRGGRRRGLLRGGALQLRLRRTGGLTETRRRVHRLHAGTLRVAVKSRSMFRLATIV